MSVAGTSFNAPMPSLALATLPPPVNSSGKGAAAVGQEADHKIDVAISSNGTAASDAASGNEDVADVDVVDQGCTSSKCQKIFFTTINVTGALAAAGGAITTGIVIANPATFTAGVGYWLLSSYIISFSVLATNAIKTGCCGNEAEKSIEQSAAKFDALKRKYDANLKKQTDAGAALQIENTSLKAKADELQKLPAQMAEVQNKMAEARAQFVAELEGRVKAENQLREQYQSLLDRSTDANSQFEALIKSFEGASTTLSTSVTAAGQQVGNLATVEQRLAARAKEIAANNDAHDAKSDAKELALIQKIQGFMRDQNVQLDQVRAERDKLKEETLDLQRVSKELDSKLANAQSEYEKRHKEFVANLAIAEATVKRAEAAVVQHKKEIDQLSVENKQFQSLFEKPEFKAIMALASTGKDKDA